MKRVGWRSPRRRSAWTPPAVDVHHLDGAARRVRSGPRSRVRAATRRALASIHGASIASTPLAPEHERRWRRRGPPRWRARDRAARGHPRPASPAAEAAAPRPARARRARTGRRRAGRGDTPSPCPAARSAARPRPRPAAASGRRMPKAGRAGATRPPSAESAQQDQERPARRVPGDGPPQRFATEAAVEREHVAHVLVDEGAEAAAPREPAEARRGRGAPRPATSTAAAPASARASGAPARARRRPPRRRPARRARRVRLDASVRRRARRPPRASGRARPPRSHARATPHGAGGEEEAEEEVPLARAPRAARQVIEREEHGRGGRAPRRARPAAGRRRTRSSGGGRQPARDRTRRQARSPGARAWPAPPSAGGRRRAGSCRRCRDRAPRPCPRASAM